MPYVTTKWEDWGGFFRMGKHCQLSGKLFDGNRSDGREDLLYMNRNGWVL